MFSEKQRDLMKRNINDWKRILQMPEGRRIVYKLLCASGFRSHGFVPNDPHATAFHCGQRSIALYMLEEIRQANFAALEQMEQEHVAEIKQINKETENVEDL
ncbi:MAG: hypothetical protein IKA93_02775 [Elusimicrobiaceae bacterium]|nr:hypothetical protein [Elusimicrobiaceae bacterium]